MKFNLIIGVPVGIIIAIILYCVFLPILSLFGFNNVYEKTNDFLDKLIFDK